MSNEDDIKRIIEKSKEINKEAEKPKLPPAPKPKPDKLEISKEDYQMLINLAKKGNEPQPSQISNVIEPPPQAYIEPEPADAGQFLTHVDEGTGYSDILANPMVLYFDTDRTCSVISTKIKGDGSVKIGERTFDFTEAQPSVLKLGGKRKKSHPFYIVKYNNTRPADMAEYPESVPTPEETNRLVNLKTLETLSTITGGKIGKMPLIILLLVGFLIGFISKLMLTLTGVW